MFAHMGRRALLAGVGLAVAAVLTACGDGGGDGSGSGRSETPTFNDADVEFAQGMIPHHEQAIEMASLAAERATSPEVKKLATQIEKAQDPEIKTMRGWLKDWRKPETPEGGHNGHGDSTHGGMDGMMSEQDMQRLKSAKGAEFDRMFATMMIEHHKGAITMADTEIADGANPDAKDLARAIKRTQSDEVKTLEDLLKGL